MRRNKILTNEIIRTEWRTFKLLENPYHSIFFTYLMLLVKVFIAVENYKSEKRMEKSRLYNLIITPFVLNTIVFCMELFTLFIQEKIYHLVYF